MQPTFALFAAASISLGLLPATVFGSVAARAAAYVPPKTYPNGTANPFFPCPYQGSDVSKCPYRCYTAAGALMPGCLSKTQASTAIANGNICTACVDPDPYGGCQPLSTYFNPKAESDGGARPSRYGTVGGKTYPACKYTCAEAQVPFNSCSKTNDTGEFELCQLTEPLCSSPRVVFAKLKVQPTFSLTNGSCATDQKLFGAPAAVACPWRCKDAGSPLFFCSLNNKTATFTTCDQC